MATLSPPAPAHAGDAVGAGLIGFGVGAILGSLFTPWEVYVGPPPYYYEPVVNASTCALSPSLVLSSIEPFNHQTKTATTAAIARTDSGAPERTDHCSFANSMKSLTSIGWAIARYTETFL